MGVRERVGARGAFVVGMATAGFCWQGSSDGTAPERAQSTFGLATHRRTAHVEHYSSLPGSRQRALNQS
jgi:hypothetical protein